jgi:hypothetical protein
MQRITSASRLLVAAVTAMAMSAGLAEAAEPQPTTPPVKKVSATASQGASVAVRPAKSAKKPNVDQAAAGTSTQVSPDGRGWSIEDALPANSPALRKDEASTEAKPFGRLQLDTGSVGIETEPKMKDNTFADGRKVPGLEYDKRNAPTYFGLSLSVPTTDKAIFPFPLPKSGE